jgi:hypothetical protein
MRPALRAGASRGIVRTVRGSTPFPSLEELGGIFARLGGALDALGRSRYGLLADLRAGPGRNDPEFEIIMEQRHRPCWIGGFRKVGVLVRSTVGVMKAIRALPLLGTPRPPFYKSGGARQASKAGDAHEDRHALFRNFPFRPLCAELTQAQDRRDDSAAW